MDTTGAGDAFAATLAYYLADGRDIMDAIRFATVAAGLSTTRQGVPNSLVDQESIELYLSQKHRTHGSTHIVPNLPEIKYRQGGKRE